MPETTTTRRRILQALAGGAGASLALPGLAAGADVHRHVAEQVRLEDAADRAAAAEALPAYLSPAQKQTLDSLAEAIVPGSAAAGVADFLDRLLAVDSPASQRQFLGALGEVESEAVERYGRAWKELDAAQRNEVLTVLSTGPSGSARRYSIPAVDAPGVLTARDRFDQLKARVALAYFTSEAGLRELGYTGEPIHEGGFAGCPHPAGHR
jgi:hypothetical protein